MQARYHFPTKCRRDFTTLSILCKLLSDNTSDIVEIELLDWNNDQGVEFDILKSILNFPMPLVTSSDVSTSNPKQLVSSGTYQMAHHSLVLMSLGASFRISWPCTVNEITFFDEIITVCCKDELSETIHDYMTVELQFKQQ